MKFKRTHSGLSNLHLFYKVDAIVFVEGGKSYSKEEVIEGNFDSNTLDIQFWRGIFSVYCESEKLQFRAIGSKSTLQSIAQDVGSGRIKGVYIAMDRDFDLIKGEMLRCKGLIYTHGYSWENDVCKKEIIEDVLDTLCVADCNITNLKSIVLSEYDDFAKKIKSGVCADALLSRDEKSFFDRKKHMSYLNLRKRSKPTVNLEAISSTFKKCNLCESKAIVFGEKNEIMPLSDCLGHLLFDYCYHLIAYALKKVGNLPSIAKYYFGCIGIDKFIDRIKNGYFDTIRQHYISSFATLK